MRSQGVLQAFLYGLSGRGHFLGGGRLVLEYKFVKEERQQTCLATKGILGKRRGKEHEGTCIL